MTVSRLSNPRRIVSSGIIAAGGTYGIHPDAADWRARAIANGGTVSTATINAVSRFCTSISNAGIRTLFRRLNLFCGDNLSACLVPLYRGPSATETYGNPTDVNANFVSGDFTETGTSGGLATGTGNTNKTLDTGLIPFNAGLTETNSHLSYYSRGGNTSVGSVLAAGYFINSTANYLLQHFINGTSGSVGMFYRSGGASNAGIENQNAERTGHIVTQRSSTGGAIYRNGANLNLTSTTTSTVTFTTDIPGPVRVFGRRFSTTGTLSVDQVISVTLQSYSIGLAFTNTQATDYYNAMQTFQTDLARNL